MSPRETGQEPLKTLTDLEQIKTLADPLRLRMLEAFGDERTTKQVADLLEEKPTRLYHHVDALERAGLIRLTRTARKRGTTEKYYRAVAESFRAELGLFAPDDGVETDPLFDLIDHTLDRTRLELREVLTTGGAAVLEEEGLHTFVEIEASRDRVERLRSELMSVLDGLRDDSPDDSSGEKAPAEDAPADQRRYRLTIALFPLAGEARG